MIDIPQTAGLVLSLLIVLSAGIVSGLSPCSLPTVLLVAGFTGHGADKGRGYGFLLALSFTAGIILVLTLLGALAGSVGFLFVDSRFFDYGIAVILAVMGLWILKAIDPSGSNGWNWISPKRGSGAAGAFLLGIPFAVAASPCTMPVTTAVLAYSSRTGSAALGASLLGAYALGRSIPLLVVGTFSSVLTRFEKIAKYQVWFERTAGAALIVIAGLMVWKA